MMNKTLMTADTFKPSTSVRDWLMTHSKHHSEYDDIDDLVHLKKSQNLRISAVLPALNEEDTIGPILNVIRREMLEEHALIDEIVVMDSSSTDRTMSVSEEAGARAFEAKNVLPGKTPCRGKGENLWKSLMCTEGDILIYIDSDIEDFSSHYISGLVGPLLRDPKIGFAKAFYERPLKLGTGPMASNQGGRVTEIFIRPMLSQLLPELTGFIQPLSGEFAARREVLETLPYPVNYGVDIGILIDVVDNYGLNSVVQVNLDQRIHRNRDTQYLGRMAFEILQILASRCKENEFGSLARSNRTAEMLQFSNGELREYVVNVFEQPPMLEVKEYRDNMLSKMNRSYAPVTQDFVPV